MEGQARNPAGDEDCWQTVITLRQKKALAQGKKLKANIGENEGNTSQPQLSKATPTARWKPFTRKLPPLPKGDFKLVIRQHQGLLLTNFTSPQLSAAVSTACRRPSKWRRIPSTPKARVQHIYCVDGGPSHE
ncbi:hypothetical protein MTO96_035365 [Rhipicephalus appendiculatus]